MSEIFTAIEDKDYLSISLLLPSHVHEKNARGESVIMALCCHGSYQHIKYAIKYGADVYEKDDDSWTVLHHAIYGQCEKTVENILMFSPDLNVTDDQGLAPIHLAILYNNLAILKMLIAADDHINKQNIYKRNLIFHCNNDCSEEMLDYLINDLNQNINHQDNAGDTVLIKAAKMQDDILVKMLLERNANKFIKNAAGKMFNDY